ncbi:hypothetical protein JXA12_04795 [Candidatus Woesearchaeota archaeon]|nr:hypothetical protein [Candidatus Woesearchaeota archaeon]
MRRAHTITLTTFVKPEEDKEAIKEQLLSLAPLDLEKEGLVVKEAHATGFNDRKITILSLTLQKERHTNAWLDHLRGRLSGAQKQQLLEQENRLDQDCQFYLRFQKKHLPKLVLIDGGDCVHVRMSIAAFPKKRERALMLMREILK